MKLKIASLFAGVCLLFSAVPQATASEHIGITNGIICKPLFPAQDGLVEYKTWGLLNKTMNQDIWVSCFIIQMLVNTLNAPGLLAAVTIVNQNNFQVSGSCLSREVDPEGAVLNTYSTPYTINAHSSGVGGFLGLLTAATNSFTVACLLTRNSYISNIFHGTFQDDVMMLESP